MVPNGRDDALGMQGWAPEELEHPEQCLACGCARLEMHYHDLKDLLGRLPGRWGFLACTQCGALHLDPRPTIAAVGKAYPDSYVTHDAGDEAHARDNGTGLVWRLVNGYLNKRFGTSRVPASTLGPWLLPLVWPVRQQLDYFYRHLPRTPGRLLDVGCGNGAFLLRARDAGWEVEGIEPDPRAAAVARSSGLRVTTTGIDAHAPEQLFDRITLSHVFEHLHEPATAVARCRKWLRPGGELWMSLPNPVGIGHRVFGRSWFALDPPRHLFLPSPAMVLKMLAEAGYSSPRLLRRGRGARSSVLPSIDYVAARGGRRRAKFGQVLSLAIDVVSSVVPTAAEEIVVIAKRDA